MGFKVSPPFCSFWTKVYPKRKVSHLQPQTTYFLCHPFFPPVPSPHLTVWQDVWRPGRRAVQRCQGQTISNASDPFLRGTSAGVRLAENVFPAKLANHVVHLQQKQHTCPFNCRQLNNLILGEKVHEAGKNGSPNGLPNYGSNCGLP